MLMKLRITHVNPYLSSRMDFELFNNYIPGVDDLDPADVRDCRTRLVAYFQTIDPDINTTVNATVGDCVVTPEAIVITALETATGDLLSDLNLSNIAQGIIKNCTFVANYLLTFSTDSSWYLKSSGIIRMVFSVDKNYVLDRSTQFTLNDTIFTIYLPEDGSFYIRPAGTDRVAGTNGITLIDDGSGGYFADVPVVGSASVEVLANDTAAMNFLPDNLVSAMALFDFDPGTQENTLPELAQRTPLTIYSPSSSSRKGIIRFTEISCPFVKSVSATIRGDKEMIRDVVNPYGMGAGYMDVFALSKMYAFTEEQVIRLNYVDADDTFTGRFYYTGQPYFILELMVGSVPVGRDGCTIYSQSSDIVKAYRAQAAYSPFEELTIVIPNTTQGGTSIYPVRTDTDGTKYIQLSINYLTDPMLPEVSNILLAGDDEPQNMNLMVKGFIPIIIESFVVQYIKEPGVIPDLVTAQEQILNYLSTCTAPDIFSSAEINTIVKQAGGRVVTNVAVAAHVQWSIADRFGDKESYVEALTEPVITTIEQLNVTYPETGYDITTLAAIGFRNRRYVVVEGAIKFEEQKFGHLATT